MKTQKYIIRNGERILPPQLHAARTHWLRYKKTPSTTFSPAQWSRSSGWYKHKADATVDIYFPKDTVEELIGGVTTYLHEEVAQNDDDIKQCWWLEYSHSISRNIVNGYVSLRWGIHGKTRRGLQRSITKSRKARIAQWRKIKLGRLSSEEVEARLRSSRRRIKIATASAAVGNCAIGTRNFCELLGVTTDRVTSIGAIYRLARYKGAHLNSYFRRAALAAI